MLIGTIQTQLEQQTNNIRRIEYTSDALDLYSIQRRFLKLECQVNMNTNQLKIFRERLNLMFRYFYIIFVEIQNIHDLINNQVKCYNIIDGTRFKSNKIAYHSPIEIDEQAYIINCSRLRVFDVIPTHKTKSNIRQFFMSPLLPEQQYIALEKSCFPCFPTAHQLDKLGNKIKYQKKKAKIQTTTKIERTLTFSSNKYWEIYLNNILNCKLLPLRKIKIMNTKSINESKIKNVIPKMYILEESCKNTKFYYKPKKHLF
jgi:hypothetical protein